jgi:hypothetical protein
VNAAAKVLELEDYLRNTAVDLSDVQVKGCDLSFYWTKRGAYNKRSGTATGVKGTELSDSMDVSIKYDATTKLWFVGLDSGARAGFYFKDRTVAENARQLILQVGQVCHSIQ